MVCSMASYVPWLTRNRVIRELLEITGGQFSQTSGSAMGGEYLSGSELEGFVHKLSLRLHSVSAAPFDLIINAADGESCNLTVYFLLTGKVQLYGNDHGSEGEGDAESLVIRTIDQRDTRSLFGSHELFEGTPPPEWCIEAAEFCDLAYISREAFQAAVREEEEIHVKFHLERAFPWTKEPEPEPEQELADEGLGLMRLHSSASESAGSGGGDGSATPDLDSGRGHFTKPENGRRTNSNSNSPFRIFAIFDLPGL